MLRKAVVLCAGEGSRLRPLTFSRPKHLLPVAGKPILGWALEAIRDAGIREVGVVVGHHAEAVRRYVGSGDTWGLSVEYIAQLQPLGLAHAVLVARDYVQDEPFLVYLGDNLFEDGIQPFVAHLGRNDWDAGLLLKAVDDPSRFGVARVSGDRVVGVAEKPVHPDSNLAIVGVYAFRASIFDAISRIEPSPRGELEITDAIGLLVAEGRSVRGSELQGLWEDAGEPVALLRANQEWLVRSDLRVAEGTTSDCEVVGKVGIETGAQVTRSKIVGPCRIGHNCIVDGSVIGPDVVVDDGCEIRHSRLRNCIVQRNTEIRNLRAGLVDSVIGEYVTIVGRDGESDGTPLSLLLGDMSHVQAR